MSIELIDIGANLTHDSFDTDREAVVQRAVDCGVTWMILTGSSVAGSQDAIELAYTNPARFRATAGMHPHHAAEYSDAAHQSFAEMCSDEMVVAVGECGLDYFRDFSPRPAQRHAFSRQLELATANQLPVFLHQRDAHDDFMAIVEPKMNHIARGVAHCFTGTENELRDYISLGLYVGITGWICDERRGAHLKDIIGLIPAERLLIETDAPYLLPRTLKPRPKTRRNEPAYLLEVLRVVAEALGQDEQTVAAQTTTNARRFFAL